MNYMKGLDDFLCNYTYESTELITWILEQGFSCKENTRYVDILHPDILPFSIICRYRKPQSAYRALPSGLSKSAVSSSTMSAFLVARSSVAMHVSNGWERWTRVGMNAQVPLSMHDCEIKTFLFMFTFHGCRRVSFSAEVGTVLWKIMND